MLCLSIACVGILFRYYSAKYYYSASELLFKSNLKFFFVNVVLCIRLFGGGMHGILSTLTLQSNYQKLLRAL